MRWLQWLEPDGAKDVEDTLENVVSKEIADRHWGARAPGRSHTRMSSAYEALSEETMLPNDEQDKGAGYWSLAADYLKEAGLLPEPWMAQRSG